MDKPISLSVKDYIIRKMAVKLMVSEKTIDAIVSHQFSSANQAMHTGDIKSVEISGFGKFFYNQKKANKRMDKMLSKKGLYENLLKKEGLSERDLEKINVRLNNTLLDIELLTPKIDNEHKTDIRGMEE